MGLSIRPPPATTPVTHRAELVKRCDHSLQFKNQTVYKYTALRTTDDKVGHSGNEDTWAPPDVEGPYQLQLCWQRRWLSWSLRAAWLWTSWSQGCERWLWRSFLKHGPACLCRRASPPGSRWWFPQALYQRAGHCQCWAELWDET